jgi:hypothetical protein
MGRGITLAPGGLVIESVETEADKLRIGARPLSPTAGSVRFASNVTILFTVSALRFGTFIQKPEGLSRDCVAPPM